MQLPLKGTDGRPGAVKRPTHSEFPREPTFSWQMRALGIEARGCGKYLYHWEASAIRLHPNRLVQLCR